MKLGTIIMSSFIVTLFINKYFVILFPLKNVAFILFLHISSASLFLASCSFHAFYFPFLSPCCVAYLPIRAVLLPVFMLHDLHSKYIYKEIQSMIQNVAYFIVTYILQNWEIQSKLHVPIAVFCVSQFLCKL